MKNKICLYAITIVVAGLIIANATCGPAQMMRTKRNDIVPPPVIPDLNCNGDQLPRCRYICFTPNATESTQPQGFRVTILESADAHDFEYMEGLQYWVTDPGLYGVFHELQTDYNTIDYDDLDHMFLVGDQRIYPSGRWNLYDRTTYRVEATYNGVNFSTPVDIITANWGDGYPACWILTNPCAGPDWVCEGFDILSILDAANGILYTTPYEITFLDFAPVSPQGPDHVIEGFDILAILDAASGIPYHGIPEP